MNDDGPSRNGKKPRLDPELKRRAKMNRREPTAPERLLWQVLRGGRLRGTKFRRQVVIEPYVVDFFCHESRLAVEVDGESHADRGEADLTRQRWLEAQGIRVLRVGNDDVLKDMETVVEAILLALDRAKALGSG
ncbi:endonuclease domain-containing protein [Paludisphaera rhizosphaerae]|uniref:endonuclease domain-containing protein n=1 Tax=Paludisphaera rhizosphaerae TaxID=2711216 RepID=UPI0013EB950A